MGGASSRFEQTQWWNADGELIPASASKRKLQEENDFHTTIIPTESPTKSLQIFDIIKCKGIASQRDFEIRDGNQKVIFVTRPVPGTMAWFDVLRPGSANEPECKEDDKKGRGKDKKEWCKKLDVSEIDDCIKEYVNNNYPDDKIVHSRSILTKEDVTIHVVKLQKAGILKFGEDCEFID